MLTQISPRSPKALFRKPGQKWREIINKRPFFLLALAFLGGILAYGVRPLILIIIVLSAFTGGLFFLPFRRRGQKKSLSGRFRIMLAVLATVAFFMGFLRLGHELSLQRTILAELPDKTPVILTGQVQTKKATSGQASWQYILKNVKVKTGQEIISCRKALFSYDTDGFSIGDSLNITGTIQYFEAASNEGQFDRNAYYQSLQVYFSIEPESVSVCPHCNIFGKESISFGEGCDRVKNRLEQALLSGLNFFSACKEEGLLMAILLGDKSCLSREQKSLFEEAGLSHVLAISGMHMTLIGMAFYRKLRKRKWSFFAAGILAAAISFSYLTMTGSGISGQRAFGTMILLLTANLLGRSVDLLNSMGFMALVLLSENPFLIRNSAFIFSFTAIGGIALLDLAFSQRGEKGRISGKKKRFLAALKNLSGKAGMAIGICLFTFPLSMYFSCEISLLAWLLNLILLPLLPVLFVSGFAGAAAGLFSPGISAVLLLPARAVLDFFSLMAARSLSVPGAYHITGKPDLWRLLIYYAGLIALLLCIGHKRGQGGKNGNVCTHTKNLPPWLEKGVGTAAAGLLILFLFLILIPCQSGFEMDFLDVGQGDAVFIRTESGAVVFVDGGSTSVTDVGYYRIEPFLKAKGVSGVDAWFVSHGDDDHVNGLLEVLEGRIAVKNLILSDQVRMEGNILTLVDKAREKGIKVSYFHAGQTLTVGSGEFTCLFPQDRWSEDVNDLSLTLLCREKDFCAFLGGDLSSEAEEKLLEGNTAKLLPDGKKDGFLVYKADHHGSRYSNSEALLTGLKPDLSIVSCGKNNRYGHPGAEAIAHIKDSGSRIMMTMEVGQIAVKRTDEGYRVRGFLQ